MLSNDSNKQSEFQVPRIGTVIEWSKKNTHKGFRNKEINNKTGYLVTSLEGFTCDKVNLEKCWVLRNQNPKALKPQSLKFPKLISKRN